MKPDPGSDNGSGKFDIHVDDLVGWVRAFAAKPTTAPDGIAIFLSHTLTDWFRQRPQLHLRCVVPIQRDGDTVELHAWYGAHLFPASLGPELEQAG